MAAAARRLRPTPQSLRRGGRPLTSRSLLGCDCAKLGPWSIVSPPAGEGARADRLVNRPGSSEVSAATG